MLVSPPSTHPPTHRLQHLIRTASISSTFLSPTHPPTHPLLPPTAYKQLALHHLNQTFLSLGVASVRAAFDKCKFRFFKASLTTHPPTHLFSHVLHDSKR